MNKINKQGFLGQPSYFFVEEGTGRMFRRIAGGMSWPGANPGALVVVGEDLNPDRALNERKLRVLAEYESRSLSELVVRCEELQGLMGVEDFYCDTTNQSMMRLFYQGEFKVSLSKAPLVDMQESHITYLQLISEKSSTAKKVLFFEKGSGLSETLSSLPDMPTDLKSEYPLISALGYALSALVLYAYENPGQTTSINYSKPLDPIIGF